ncbi:hypothetical protein OG948_60440 (plasmid) [Embleya sp. NBC_00888]|uniref:hypothetical protein n=1 Tax=Embleya sp. NBC_00888 TaxID=2975960 RepID=UPI003863E441|nr:hypothetical protein OG948_60440 [Embleya sp. NBC_00888]
MRTTRGARTPASGTGGTCATAIGAVSAHWGVTGAQARAWLVANGHHDAARRHFGTSA